MMWCVRMGCRSADLRIFVVGLECGVRQWHRFPVPRSASARYHLPPCRYEVGHRWGFRVSPLVAWYTAVVTHNTPNIRRDAQLEQWPRLHGEVRVQWDRHVHPLRDKWQRRQGLHRRHQRGDVCEYVAGPSGQTRCHGCERMFRGPMWGAWAVLCLPRALR